jgi:IrrE N-terminal-like domain
MLAVAETLVNAFCHALGFSGPKRRPRVDVFALAESAGAELVITSQLCEDGRIEDTPYATRIFLDRSPAKARRRFTLGHELGHFVLSDPKVFRLVRPQFVAERLRVEQLCDAFAAELLMPRKWIVKAYDEYPEEIDLLFDLSQRAEVSLAAGLTRLTTVLGWRSSLLYFQRERNWAPLITAGRVRRHDVRLAAGADELLWQTYRTEGSQKHTIALFMNGREVELQGEMRATGNGVMCLVDLSPPQGGGASPGGRR